LIFTAISVYLQTSIQLLYIYHMLTYQPMYA